MKVVIEVSMPDWKRMDAIIDHAKELVSLVHKKSWQDMSGFVAAMHIVPSDLPISTVIGGTE